MLEPMRLVIAILATYRLAVLFSMDNGPFDIIARLRQLLAKNAAKSPIIKSAASGIVCPYCVGVWFAALCLALAYIAHPASDAFLLVFAVAGGQSFLQEMGGK